MKKPIRLSAGLLATVLFTVSLAQDQMRGPIRPAMTNGCNINIQPIGSTPFNVGLEFSGAESPDGYMRFTLTTGHRQVHIGRANLQAVAKPNKQYRVVIAHLPQGSPRGYLLDLEDMSRQYFYVYDDDTRPSYSGYGLVPQLRGDGDVDLYIHKGEHAIRIPIYR